MVFNFYNKEIRNKCNMSINFLIEVTFKKLSISINEFTFILI